MSDVEQQTPVQETTQSGQQGQAPKKQQPSNGKKGKGPLTEDMVRQNPTLAMKMLADARREQAKMRQKLKAKGTEENVQATKEAEERGEYKALYEQASTRLKEAEAKVTELTNTVKVLQPFKDSADKIALEAREAALAKIPEDMRSTLQNADVTAIEAVAARIAAPGASPATPAAPAKDPIKTGDADVKEDASASVPGASGFGSVFNMLEKNKG